MNGQDSNDPSWIQFVEQIGGDACTFVIWGDIDYEGSENVSEFVRDTVAKNRKFNKLNIILESPGGFANVSFKWANMLRQCCTKLVVYVPHMAKSAATLMCLAADEIVLSLKGELGPIDTQVQDTNEPVRFVSAQLGNAALAEIADFVETEFHGVLISLTRDFNINTVDSLAAAERFATNLGRPLLEQLRPLELAEFKRALKMSTTYGTRLLQRRGLDIDVASKIVRKLVYTYPSHSFVIDFEEARMIGLPVKMIRPDQEKGFSDLYKVLQRSIHKLKLIGYYGLLRDFLVV